jgi:uncharacterized protein YceK
MKTLVSVIVVLLIIMGCQSSKTATDANGNASTKVSDTVTIANDSLEYEVTIIDPGFSSWLVGRALPRGYYSENYLEVKNQLYVSEWNRRAMQPTLFDSKLYEMQINYDINTRYGYEVNYLIYNYFIYFQNRYNQKLAGFVPRQ